VKTHESEKVTPLDDEMVADLLPGVQKRPMRESDLRMLSVFFSKSMSHHCMQDWIFASGRMKGRQPLWPEAIIRNYIRPAALRAEIAKPITWHVFRHYADLLTIPGEPWIESLRSLNEEVRVHMPMVHPA
jgi:hypothetical protein